MNTFIYKCYKQALKDSLVQKQKQVSSRFNYQNMAKAAGIQKTYLSRVLNSDTSHLNEEQLFLAARYIGLSKEERDFLQLLRTYDRACNPAMKTEIAIEIDSIRKKYQTTDAYLETSKHLDSEENQKKYYLDPNISLVHMFLTIPKYQNNLSEIARCLYLEKAELDDILTYLESSRIIELKDDGYKVLRSVTHLSSSSPLYKSFSLMQRLKTMERLNKKHDDTCLSLSVAFSSNRQIKEKLHQKLLDLIAELQKEVGEASEEEVYQLNIDLFNWNL